MLMRCSTEHNIKMEVIIVDDNSPDGTQDQVKDLIKIYGADKIILNARPGKMGLGSAYIDGLKRCSGTHVILMDADLSHHVSFQLHISNVSFVAKIHPHVHRQNGGNRH
jgi:dolichol-phosphate mannosyltransferase